MRFTDAQQAAIEADNRELLVSAAAGSGKTAVLVERILYMIQNRGMSVDRMLVVTFTRAAASELRERLELRLAEAAQQNPKLHQQAELVSNAQISTIHAFCQKVVRQNFQHCEIDPQFTLTDEATRARLYGESLNEVLDRLYKNAKTDADLASLVRKFTERELCAIVDSLYAFLLSRPNPMAWLQAHTSMLWDEQTLDAHPLGLAFCAEAKLMLAGIFAAWTSAQALTTDAAFPQPYLATLRSDGETINELSKACEAGLTQLGNTLGAIKFVTLARFKPDVEQEAKLAQAFKDERERYKGMVKELKALLPADCAQGVRDMKEMQAATRGLEKLLCDFHKDFSARKLENTVLDFNDLEHMTLSVLQNEPLRQQQSQLFDALFVDEYQDVSALQEAILNGLKRAPQHGSKQYVFYVGDVKQSIYRFRSAEPTLFLRKQQAFSALADAPCRRIVLNRNFRSRTGVLDAVNRVFSHVMDSRITEIDYDDDARLYPGTPSERDPQTELHVLNSSGHKPVDMVRAEAGIIARDIQATKDCPVYDAAGKESGTLHYRDIAILLPVSKGVSQKVEEELARAGIPVYCENGADSLKSDEIVQLVQHLMLMDNLMNDLALLSELRGPIFEMTEAELSRIRLSKPEREASFFAALLTCAREGRDMALRTRCSDVLSMLEQERFLYSSMPLAEYLWDFLTRNGLYVHYGAQPGGKLRQANLRMLCHQAGEYEKSHADGLR
ncbi:MAG: UvrD-helicase domain-containing protein, partial [Clostridia bacterium]